MELKIKIKKDGCLFLFGVIYIIEVCHNNNFKSIIKSTKEKKIVQKLEFQFSLVSFL